MIRIANINDTERLAELFIELHRRHVEIRPDAFLMPECEWFKRRISEILVDKEQTVLVHADGEIDGYAVVKLINVNVEDKPPRRMCYIDCFAVSENCRRQGIGTRLFDAVKQFGKERGCDTIQLGVNADNADAIKFYKKMGLNFRTIQMEVKL